ncbi:MAG TPA: chemotaxis protein CheW [Vicinamibacterales bacterium]|jgi:purine-binding chemotaxis protein CheW|nr:chemotaxis protein CheW [Vicinamibacterales bacterium]
MTQSHQLATFDLDGLLFAIEVEKIQEILGFQEMTPVPLAPPAVEGLINLRGQIITAVDLRRRLGLRKRIDGSLPVNVVIRDRGDVLSFLVDMMGEVVEVGDESFELPPETMDSDSRALIRGIHKLGDRLLHVLDVEEAIKLPAVEGERDVSGSAAQDPDDWRRSPGREKRP